MFSNLKKKIQKEGGLVPGSDAGSSVPGGASPLMRKGSNGSLGSLQDLRESARHNGISEEKVTVHHPNDVGKEDLAGQLYRKTEQCKRLEAKISELAATIKEKMKHIERLNAENEKKNHDHREAVEDLHNRQEESETALREMFQESLKRKEDENERLKAKVSDAEAYKTRYLKREEESEEIQDYTTQELAKVKHMFLNAQSELVKSEQDLRDKQAELEKSNRAISDLETHIETLNIEIAHHKNESEKFDGNRQKVNSEIQSLKSKISTMESQISVLKAESSEKSASLSSLEGAHANLLTEHQILQRNGEVYRNKVEEPEQIASDAGSVCQEVVHETVDNSVGWMLDSNDGLIMLATATASITIYAICHKVYDEIIKRMRPPRDIVTKLPEKKPEIKWTETVEAVETGSPGSGDKSKEVKKLRTKIPTGSPAKQQRVSFTKPIHTNALKSPSNSPTLAQKVDSPKRSSSKAKHTASPGSSIPVVSSSKVLPKQKQTRNSISDTTMKQLASPKEVSSTTVSLNEKDEEIAHLKERVETLEQRVQDCDLIGDDQTEAVKAERDTLEQKLADIRQQLVETKLKSAERIGHLEDQISHLNAKILEDHEEISMNEKAAESMRENFQLQLDELQAKLFETEKRALDSAETLSENEIAHEKEIYTWELEMKKLRQYSSATERDLEEKVTKLETQMASLKTQRDEEKTNLRQQISELQKMRDELLAKDIESENVITKLKEEKAQIQDKFYSMDKQCVKLTSQLDERQRELTSSGIDKTNLEDECTNLKEQVEHLQKSLKTKQQHYTDCSREKDKVLLRNAELSQQVEAVKRNLTSEKRELEKELSSQKDRFEVLQAELKALQEKCEDLESERNMVMVNIESAEISRYKETIQALEQQLAEKNKTVKVQQQRLADLKKTLQRELKVQSFPNDEMDRSIRDSNELLDTRLAKASSQSPPVSRNHVTSSANQCLDIPSSSTSQTTSSCGATSQTMTSCGNASHVMSDVNLCYLKNVLLKFLLSREAESIHLVKAISTLLKLTREEQRLLRETLEYKMSWFPVRKPAVGKGQMSKAIPPSW